MQGELLEDLGTVVRIGPAVESVSHSHMLRHRKGRIRRKWRKRLGPAMHSAFVRAAFDAIREAMGEGLQINRHPS